MKSERKGKGWRTLAVTAMVALVLAVVAPAFATSTGPLYRTTYPSKISNKLGRGLGNMLFCWVEIPIEINQEVQNTDLVTGSIVGFGLGLFRTGQRFVIGAVDVVTFPVDIYGNNYQSVQRTEFPFIDEVE